MQFKYRVVRKYIFGKFDNDLYQYFLYCTYLIHIWNSAKRTEYLNVNVENFETAWLNISDVNIYFHEDIICEDGLPSSLLYIHMYVNFIFFSFLFLLTLVWISWFICIEIFFFFLFSFAFLLIRDYFAPALQGEVMPVSSCCGQGIFLAMWTATVSQCVTGLHVVVPSGNLAWRVVSLQGQHFCLIVS